MATGLDRIIEQILADAIDHADDISGAGEAIFGRLVTAFGEQAGAAFEHECAAAGLGRRCGGCGEQGEGQGKEGRAHDGGASCG